jgi:hypothetical protein
MLAILITGVPPHRSVAGPGGRVDVKVVSDRLGRSTTRITQDLYTHVRYEVHAAAAAQIVDLLRPQRSAEGRGGDPVSSPRSTPGLPRVPRCSRRCCSGTGSKNTATVLNTSATPPMSALAQVAQSPGSRQRSISPEHHLS